MDFTFKRSFVTDTYFNDLGITVRSGNKLDFYEHGKLTGTLIDSFKISIGLFRNSTTYFTKKQGFWTKRNLFELIDDSEAVFATGNINSPSSESSVLFPATGITYQLSMRSNHRSQSKFRSSAEFHFDDNVYCVIDYYPHVESPSWWKRNFSNSPFEGVIELAEGLSREHLFAFMLVMNRQIEINSD